MRIRNGDDNICWMDVGSEEDAEVCIREPKTKRVEIQSTELQVAKNAFGSEVVKVLLERIYL